MLPGEYSVLRYGAPGVPNPPSPQRQTDVQLCSSQSAHPAGSDGDRKCGVLPNALHDEVQLPILHLDHWHAGLRPFLGHLHDKRGRGHVGASALRQPGNPLKYCLSLSTQVETLFFPGQRKSKPCEALILQEGIYNDSHTHDIHGPHTYAHT